ncbi:hypothetical protein Prudu_010118 [Prunus dulcis]|uniref:Uncharacterized protein n=1 Tax=Prunus dulcis TaxID=3755 RepID=A0A4Y1R7V0_PRUDU|nr:hypothetical protein Prudu_010118 [Prunus dulcis]
MQLSARAGTGKQRERERERAKMNNITASELAGFGVGGSAPLCHHCCPKGRRFHLCLSAQFFGNVQEMWQSEMIACSRCKGVGLIKEGGVFGLNLIDDFYESVGGSDSKE